MKNIKNLKKIISVILASSALLTLNGCDKNNAESISAADSETASTVVSSDNSGLITSVIESSPSSEAQPEGSAPAESTTGLPELNTTKYGLGHYTEVDREKSLSLSREEVYKGFPLETKFESPKIGGNTILSMDSNYGVTASLVAMCIGAFPNDNKGFWEASGIYLIIQDSSGRTAYMAGWNGRVAGNDDSTDGTIGSIMEYDSKCICGHSTRLFEVEQNGKKHVILMQYTKINEDETISPIFFDCDLENYEGIDEEPSKTTNTLKWYGIRDYGAFNHGFPISDEFKFVEGTTFTDPKYNYNITFDCENHTAEVTKF